MILLAEARRVLTCDNDPAGATEVGASPGLTQPGGIALLADDTVVVADQADGRIGFFDSTTSTWTTRFSMGHGTGEFARPTGICADPSDRLIVSDRGNRRVVRTNADGSGWSAFGAPGSGVGQFVDPVSVAVDGEDRILIADPGAGRVIRIDQISGAGWTRLPHAGTQPWGVAAGAGWWAVADAATRSVSLYDDDDALIATSDSTIPFLAPTLLAGYGSTFAVGDPATNDVWVLSDTGGTLEVDVRLRGSSPTMPEPAWEQLGGIALGRPTP